MDRIKQLSPSGSQVRVAEENGGWCAYITDNTRSQVKLTAGALSLLVGLLKVVLSGDANLPPRAKLPVRRKLRFEDSYLTNNNDNDADDVEIPCGQADQLISLDVAMQPGYINDGWMTSRVQDIPWRSEVTIPANYLGLIMSVPSRAMEQDSKFLQLSPEVLYIIMDNLTIRDVLNLSQCCEYIYSIVNTPVFWRKRLSSDFNCYSFICWDSTKKGLDIYRECYKLCHWAEHDDAPYEEMEK